MGVFQTNTYTAISGETAVVIDPCGDAQSIFEQLQGAKLAAILLTHGHFDHTSAAAELARLTDAKIYIHSADEDLLSDKKKSFASIMPEEFCVTTADVLLKGGEVLDFGDLSFRVLHTPGHSPGSVLYIVDDVIFAGDTLFAGSVGRTDGYGGCSATQAKSLEAIKAIVGDYAVLAGHGPQTTLEAEKRTNPYLADEADFWQ